MAPRDLTQRTTDTRNRLHDDVDVWALLLSLGAMVAIFHFKIGMIPVLATASALGIALYLAGLT